MFKNPLFQKISTKLQMSEKLSVWNEFLRPKDLYKYTVSLP